MSENNKIVDLKKVQWVELRFRNQLGQLVKQLPPTPTASCFALTDDLFCPAIPKLNWPRESLLARAMRKKIVDKWTPVLTLQLTANHSLTYTGEKALTLYKAWCAKIYGSRTTNAE
jgi:hypothetical protein